MPSISRAASSPARQQAAEIVAFDHRDARRLDTLLARQRRDACRGGARIGRAEIADNPDPFCEAALQDGRDEPLERGIIAARRIGTPFELRQRQRPFRQCLEHQEARAVALGQRLHNRTGGIRAVAGKAGAAANEDGLIGHTS